MTIITEADVEEAALAWLVGVGWQVKRGRDIAPEAPDAERGDYGQVVLERRLRDALAELNPDLPVDALDDALRRLTRPQGSTLEARNRAFHRMLVDGVTVEHRTPGGAVRGAQARIVDFDNPDRNDWLAVNQLTVTENRNTRRPDVVLFVNGLPLGVIELKNPADEDATIWTAWQQLQTYRAELPTLFSMNEALMVSDGAQARVGALTAGREWFKPWRTIGGETLADPHMPELQVMLEGVCAPAQFAALVRDFIVFDDDGSGALVKKMAGYHQFHAVRVAVRETLRAAELQQKAGEGFTGRYEAGRKPGGAPGGAPGDRRIGVVWHTQGSGKSLTMAFYAGAIVRETAMQNPTVVVLTDRNDLDDQLFGTFSRCRDLLRQPPTQAESRADLRRKLSVESGGVVFTTIQKFFPEEKGDTHPTLSDRRNVVVIADEAHRSQYDFIDGYARHMRDALPNASFVGFTGTPIELQDANTRAVFGDYISIYDIKRSVEDGATVPIYYESRLAKLALDEAERPAIDPDFEEATEGEEVERKEKLKTRWAQLEAVVGAEKRVKLVAEDIVEHFEQRLEALDGKAMVVCMSRRICVDLHRELVRLRPHWHDDDDGRGAIKVVMTGSASDPPEWQQHIRNKPRREALANRFRDASDPLRVVLVRDMWLTGFDAPSLHTMYVDKPMRGHGLMQAIARVNRVFKDKPGGLVVDYLGLAADLRSAVATYTESGGTGADHRRQGGGGGRDAGEVRCLLRPLPRLRPGRMDDGCGTGAVGAAARRAGARPGPGERQGALPAIRPRAVSGLRACRAPRGADPHPRRRGVLPGGASAADEAGPRRGAPRGGPGRSRAPDHLPRGGVRGRDGHLRGGGTGQARYIGAVGRVPVRGAGNAASQPGRGASAEAAPGRGLHPAAQERGAGTVLRRDAGADAASLPEPGDRGGAGHRGADPACQGHAGGQRTRAKAPGAVGGRAGLLRRVGDQRQRGPSPRRRDAPRHRAGARADRPQQRHHRLDAARERARAAPRPRPAHPAQARLPAGQAGESDTDRPGAGGGAIGGVGEVS